MADRYPKVPVSSSAVRAWEVIYFLLRWLPSTSVLSVKLNGKARIQEENQNSAENAWDLSLHLINLDL